MRNTYLLLLLGFISLFNFDSVICDFSPSNSIFTPLELEHEIPGTTFKISIELKDENNNDILITDQDPLFDELDCIINGSMLLYKYMDQDDKFVCAFSCGFPQAGESIIEVFHNDNLIREYIIGEPTGMRDLSKSKFNAFNLFVEAGEIRPYLTIGIYSGLLIITTYLVYFFDFSKFKEKFRKKE